MPFLSSVAPLAACVELVLAVLFLSDDVSVTFVKATIGVTIFSGYLTSFTNMGLGWV